MNIQGVIARRAKRRKWDAAKLAADTGLPEARVQKILDGDAPTRDEITKFRDATTITQEEADRAFDARDRLEERGLD